MPKPCNRYVNQFSKGERIIPKNFRIVVPQVRTKFVNSFGSLTTRVLQLK